MAEPERSPPTYGLLLSEDLLFTSRITGTASALGLTVKPARTVIDLEGLARRETPSCVLVDLSHPGLEVGGLIRRLREICSPVPRVVAYGSHVDTASLRSARTAGCDVVLPRSKFIEDLPSALPAWLSAPINNPN